MKTSELLGTSAAFIFLTATMMADAQPSPQQVVDAFLNGQPAQKHIRSNHAKGVCLTGEFVGNGDLTALSRSPLWQANVHTKVIGRFSLPGNNVQAADAAVPVRGMAVQFQLNDGQIWHSAMNNSPVFAVATPQAFYEQQLAQKPDEKTGKPDPKKLADFFATHPETAAFRAWAKATVPSGSYADQNYHSLNAFVLVNAQNAKQFVRWTLHSDNPSAEKNAANLEQDLFMRLKAGGLRWSLLVTLAEPQDPTDNATLAWPAERNKIKAGTLIVRSAQAQENGPCRDISFMPTQLPDGIELGNDPLVNFRSAAYAESLGRRL